MKKIFSVLPAMLVMLCAAVTYADTQDLLMQNPPVSADIGGEWAVIGIARSEFADAEWLAEYENALKARLDAGSGVLSEYRFTEYARAVLALTAIGVDASDFYGYDLTAPLFDFDKVCNQGVNGAAFALIALDCHEYTAPEGLRGQYVDYIMSQEIKDADRQAMAICAVQNYADTEAMRTRLAEMPADTCEAEAQRAIVLKNAAALEKYRLADGGYSHTVGSGYNAMSTEQAFYAIVSVQRDKNGLPPLYDMNDIELSARKPEEKTEIITTEKDFSDISDSRYAEDIRMLAADGIISGVSATEFAPGRTVTRAEFAALIVRMLELDAAAAEFDDVSADDWFCDAVGAAYSAGIIRGISDTLFAPDSEVTRAQAAAMVYRAVNAQISVSEARIYLSAFDDDIDCPEYAEAAIGKCIKNDAYPYCDMELLPNIPMRRDETAHMLMGILKK